LLFIDRTATIDARYAREAGEISLSPEYPKLEAETREEIDAKLIASGWVIQDKKRLNLYASLGVAVREMDTDTGPTDYMLFNVRGLFYG